MCSSDLTDAGARIISRLTSRAGASNIRILPEGAAEAAKTAPPNTRALQRSRFINAAVAAGEQFTVDWVHLKLNAYPQHTLVCKDPFATGSEELEEVLSLLASKARQHQEAAFPPPC